jgi:hypothetical protein
MGAVDFFLERVTVDAGFARHLDRWRRLRAIGWTVTVLDELSTPDVVAMGVRGDTLPELKRDVQLELADLEGLKAQ